MVNGPNNTPARSHLRSHPLFRLRKSRSLVTHYDLLIAGGRGAGGYTALVKTISQLDDRVAALRTGLRQNQDALKNGHGGVFDWPLLGPVARMIRKQILLRRGQRLEGTLRKAERFKILVLDKIGIEPSATPTLHLSAALYQAALGKMMDDIRRGDSHSSFEEHYRAAVHFLYESYQESANECLRRWKAQGRIDYLVGTAQFRSPRKGGVHHLRVESKSGSSLVTAHHAILATGSVPNRFDASKVTFVGKNPLPIEDSEAFFRRAIHPKRVTIIGGGIIGLEVASLLKYYGHDVTVLQRGTDVLEMVHAEARQWVVEQLHKPGDNGGRVKILTNATLRKVEMIAEENACATVEMKDASGAVQEWQHETGEIVAVLGRRPNVDGLGLEHFGISPALSQERRGLWVDHYFRVQDPHRASVEGLYAIGDTISQRQVRIEDKAFVYPWLRTLLRILPAFLFDRIDRWQHEQHTVVRLKDQPLQAKLITAAEAQAELVTDFLFAGINPYYDERDFAQKIFTDPKIAMFGPQNDLAKIGPDKAFSITRYYKAFAPLEEMDPDCDGLLKVWFDRKTGKILAAVATGPHAHDLVQEITSYQKTVTAMTPDRYPLQAGPSRASILRALLAAAKVEMRRLEQAAESAVPRAML